MKKIALSIVALCVFSLAAPAADPVVVMQVGTMSSPTSLLARMQDYWCDLVAKESNGEIKITNFPAGQLGKQQELFDQMYAGAPIVTQGTATFFADLGVPDFGITQAPFLYKNWDEVRKLRDSDWWKEQERILEEKGYKILAYNIQYGARHMLSRKLVKTPADLVGMKFRVPASNVYVKMYEALGGSPTPMALSEVYTALQQGTIDGEENPLTTLVSEKHYEVAKFLLLDGHLLDLQCQVTSAEFFDTLSEKHQKILIDTCLKAGDWYNSMVDKADAEALEIMEKAGVTVTREFDRAAFEKAAEKFYTYPEFSNWTPGLKDKIRAIIDN